MSQVLPKNGFFKITKLPQYGHLILQGQRVRLGTNISQDDVNSGRLMYQSTSDAIPQEPENDFLEDYFEFVLYKIGLDIIRADSYGPCMPEREIETPADGIFRFDIRVYPLVKPEVIIDVDRVSMGEGTSYLIDKYLLNAELGDLPKDMIFHKVISAPKYGYISVRGKQSETFTQADIDSKSVRYVNMAYGGGSDTIEIQTCTSANICSNPIWITFDIMPQYEQTGDNVLYAKMGSSFSWTFETNRTDAVWFLQGGTTVGPRNSVLPSDEAFEWSEYALGGDDESDPTRGPGYDKLNEYRNLTEKYYWQGGLPEGVAVSNFGYIGTQLRQPSSKAGSQPWRIPNNKSQYVFTLGSIDPKTGEQTLRRYRLVVNETGTNIDGLTSESARI